MRYWLSIFCVFVLHFAFAEEEGLVHECGVALVRLKKPITHYAEKYGDPSWGIKKLLVLMEKQRNRGQDGAGIAVAKFNMPIGHEYLHQVRSIADNAVDDLFSQVFQDLQKLKYNTIEPIDEINWKQQSPFVGEAMLGHLRYSTHSSINIKCCQPFIRCHGMACRHFALAGNFNMTNTQELFHQLEDLGMFPTSESDTQAIIDILSHHLDKEHERISSQMKTPEGRDRAETISSQIDFSKVLANAASSWDGGYVFCGLLGNGDSFICRDPAGIRPGYFYMNDEVFAAASERVALMEAFDLQDKDILPIQPGHVILIKKNGEMIDKVFLEPIVERQCSFERIYFSKASDPQIYEERKALGRNLAPKVFEAIGGDLENSIFTYVPNSSLSAFQGLVDEMSKIAKESCLQRIKQNGTIDLQDLEKLASIKPRAEYLIAKNQKLRTFISADSIRKNLVAQLYEITKGVVTPETTLVVIDDSIIRGVTLKDSLVKKLIKLNPKKIVIVSSAPPVFYPDCYGIDMSQIGRFVAFQAAVCLLQERGQSQMLDKVNELCQLQKDSPSSQIQNQVKNIVDEFTLEEISAKVAEIITPSDTDWKGTVQVIYQSLDGLHKAMPGFTGDWYFSGNYPTPGGFKVLNNSYLKWRNGDDSRSY